MPKAKKHPTIFVFQFSSITFEVQIESELQREELTTLASSANLKEINRLNLESGTWIIYSYS